MHTKKSGLGFHLSISLVKECNYKCSYCYPFGQNKEVGENMSLPEAKEVIKSATDTGFRLFRFTGGEPTLSPFFKEIFEFTLRINPENRIIVVTNGSKLEEFIKLFEKHKDRLLLQISLDSISPKSKRYGNYKCLSKKLHNDLKKLSEARVPIRINMVVMRHNKVEVFDMIALAKDLNAEIKLFNLFLQDKYIATHGINGSFKTSELSALEFWKKNYFNLDGLIQELRGKASEEISVYNPDGGFGIPQHCFMINGTKVIIGNSARGAFHNRTCVEKCPFFGKLCEKGVYNPQISSNMVLYIDDCYNKDLRFPLRGKTYNEKLAEFRKLLSLLSNLVYVPEPPKPIRDHINEQSSCKRV